MCKSYVSVPTLASSKLASAVASLWKSWPRRVYCLLFVVVVVVCLFVLFFVLFFQSGGRNVRCLCVPAWPFTVVTWLNAPFSE